MKLNITTENLRKALARLSSVPGVVASHLPTLAVIIEADDFAAKLRRTTAIASVSVTLEAEVEEAGACAIAYDTFVNTVNAMLHPNTTLESDPKTLWVKSGKSKGELSAYPPDELLPEPPTDKASETMSFLTSDLLKWLAVAQGAAATDAKEAKFAGVCMRVMLGHLCLFGVDRRRSHVVFVAPRKEFLNPAEGGKMDFGFLIINESVAALRKLLPEGDCGIELSFCGGSLRAKVSDVEALLPLGADGPPDMTPFLPKREPADIIAQCSRADLLQAARTAVPLGYQDTRVISVNLHEGDMMGGSVEIVADNRSGAKIGHEIDATVAGGSKNLRATGQYLIDLADAMEGNEFTLNFAPAKHMIYSYGEDRLCILLLVRDEANANG